MHDDAHECPLGSILLQSVVLWRLLLLGYVGFHCGMRAIVFTFTRLHLLYFSLEQISLISFVYVMIKPKQTVTEGLLDDDDLEDDE